MKHRIFIGSSTEGEKIARAIHLDLHKDYNTTLWSCNVFRPGISNLEALLEQVKQSDFGIFVLSPDDIVTVRNELKQIPRDNVLFELGLFMGRIGRFRTICVIQKGDEVKKLSDLDGISMIRYPKQLDDPENDLMATCTEIRNCIDRQCKAGSFPAVQSVNETAISKGISWDCTTMEFVEHLKQANKVHIIGITNENLVGHLNRAFEARGQEPWAKLDIVFISKRLMHLYKKLDENESAAIRRWEAGVASVRAFCYRGKGKSASSSVRYIDSIIPFIGQVYDDLHVRVSFVLPFNDLKKSCFLNYQDLYPPCHYQDNSIPVSILGNHNNAPPCKRDLKDQVDCHSCAWQHFSCQSLSKTILEIKNYSTPLFAANVVGSVSMINTTPRFFYEALIPQLGWQKYRSDLGSKTVLDKPVHLCAFVLLYTQNRIIFQRRTTKNSGGDDLDKLSLLAEKVCDEDFLIDPSMSHRKKVQSLQEALLDNYELSSSFSSEVVREKGHEVINKGKVVPDEILIDALKRASVKGLMEKLGIFRSTDTLKPDLYTISKQFNLIEHQHYMLFGTVFCLKIDTEEINKVLANRPTVALEALSIQEFERNLLNQIDKFGHYLQQYQKEILELAKLLFIDQH